MKKILLFMILSLSLSYAQGCWDAKENRSMEFEELNDVIVFSIKNAVDCTPIPHAYVNFGGVKLSTDKQGKFTVPKGVLNNDRTIKMLIKHKGYISLVQKVRVEAGSIWKNKLLMSPKLPLGSARFVLSWSDKPKDMDLHLTSDDFHISFRKTKSIRNIAALDRDAKRGYGPETITLDKIKEDKTYALYVHQYSSDGSINGDIQVEVYLDNKLEKTISLVKTNKRFVKVLELTTDGVKYTNTPKNSI